MAKKVEWTLSAIQDRSRIYQFWKERNKSERYSQNLERLFEEASRLLSEFPEIGTESDIPDLRVKVIKTFKLFYFNQEDTIQIVRVWDTRQDPDTFKPFA